MPLLVTSASVASCYVTGVELFVDSALPRSGGSRPKRSVVYFTIVVR